MQDLNLNRIDKARLSLYFLKILFKKADGVSYSVRAHDNGLCGEAVPLNATCMQFFITILTKEPDGLSLPIKSESNIDENFIKKFDYALATDMGSSEIGSASNHNETDDFKGRLYSFLNSLVIIDSKGKPTDDSQNITLDENIRGRILMLFDKNGEAADFILYSEKCIDSIKKGESVDVLQDKFWSLHTSLIKKLELFEVELIKILNRTGIVSIPLN